MNTIIEKIRALIKMQIRREELKFASLGGGGQTMNIGALEWVLKQLDTLQEPPLWIRFAGGVYPVHATKELPGRIVAYEIEDTPGHFDLITNPEEVMTEQPVSEELEEEITKWFAELDKKYGVTIDFGCADIESTARHFAQWGAEHRGSSEIPKDLEEAAKAYADDTNPTDSFYEAFKEGALWMREQMMDEWLKDRDGCFWDGVEEGKKAMREQMMKEAVEGEVVTTNKYTSVRYLSRYGTFRYFYGIGGGFQKGDRVKLIIVKED